MSRSLLPISHVLHHTVNNTLTKVTHHTMTGYADTLCSDTSYNTNYTDTLHSGIITQHKLHSHTIQNTLTHSTRTCYIPPKDTLHTTWSQWHTTYKHYVTHTDTLHYTKLKKHLIWYTWIHIFTQLAYHQQHSEPQYTDKICVCACVCVCVCACV